MVFGVRPPKPTLYWVTRRGDLPRASQFDPTERFNRLRGARLEQVMLPAPDRLLRLDFDKEKDEENLKFALWLGWMGGRGNVWLVDPGTGIVLETLWKSSIQSLGKPFSPPTPPPLLDWRTMTYPDYARDREEHGELPLRRFLRKRLWGIDDQLAEYLESRSEGNNQWEEFSQVIGALRHITDPDTPLCIERNERQTWRIIPKQGAGMHHDTTTSLAHILARLAREEVEETHREQLSDRVRRQIETRIAQLRRRLKAAEQAIVDGERAESTKRLGDLLNANRHLLQRGMSSVEVTDWEQGGTETVDLDPKLTPQENIEAYYKRARKLARGGQQARSVKPQIESDLQEAEKQLAQLVSGELDPEMVETAASSEADQVQGKRSGSGTQAPRVPFREFTVGKYTILVGKSRRDNDELTLHVARPHDLFLHADKVGGSHVIVRVPEKGREVPRDVLTVAAQAAAYFSKARHSGVVPVIYTEVRYVNKPRKAPPGLVRVTREQTLMVQPVAPPGYHSDGGAA
ncbi:MAG: fibronectin-binding protein EfbA [Candidatus Zixiibacteriota bacterium]